MLPPLCSTRGTRYQVRYILQVPESYLLQGAWCLVRCIHTGRGPLYPRTLRYVIPATWYIICTLCAAAAVYNVIPVCFTWCSQRTPQQTTDPYVRRKAKKAQDGCFSFSLAQSGLSHSSAQQLIFPVWRFHTGATPCNRA